MAEIQTKRHPIRAALYGLILGISIWYFLQFEFAMFPLDSRMALIVRAVIVVAAVMVLAVAWAYVAPARKPKEPAPAPAAPEPAPAAAPAAPEPAPATGAGGPALPDDDE